MSKNEIILNYGAFSLVEFLLSEHNKIPLFYKTALDIGGGDGFHTNLMRRFGLNVDLIDKYLKNAEINADFNDYKFKKKYDVIFCSHVVEHQRNIGFFLDKIFDILSDDGVLIISGPKHPVERFVEGHISTCILPVFLQMLIYSGFDCKNGKMLSLGGIENSFIVKKDKSFDFSERKETGYKWTKKHQKRSPIKLEAGYEVRPGSLYLHNCEIWKVNILEGVLKERVGLGYKLPKKYNKKNIKFKINSWSNFYLFDEKLNQIAGMNQNLSENYVKFII